MRVNNDCGPLRFLLNNGLQLGDYNSWKYLNVLTNIMYDVPRCKGTITNLLKNDFAKKTGHLLDNMHDFQQANFTIELLSNCFPRKALDKPGVVLPPNLWEDSIKNELFFNRINYPFRGKHGDQQVINFVWELFSSMLTNTRLVSSVIYGMSNDMKKINHLTVKGSKNQCVIQTLHDNIYFWNGECNFFELKRSSVSLLNDLKGRIKIKKVKPNSKSIQSTNKIFIASLIKSSWLQIEFQSQQAGTQYFKDITNIPKISEPQTFLLLNYVDEENLIQQEEESEEEIDEAICKEPIENVRELSILLSESFPPITQAPSNKTSNETNMLVTPEHSDAKNTNDIWDINISSDPTSKEHNRTNAVGSMIDNILEGQGVEIEKSPSIDYADSSPTVISQKNKKRRASDNKKNIIRDQPEAIPNFNSNLNGKIEIPERTDSILITGTNIIKDKRDINENNKLTEMLFKSNSKAKKVSNTVPKKSIAKEDIQVLDAIFAKPSFHTRKRQQKLSNIISVAKKHKYGDKNSKKISIEMNMQENSNLTSVSDELVSAPGQKTPTAQVGDNVDKIDSSKRKRKKNFELDKVAETPETTVSKRLRKVETSDKTIKDSFATPAEQLAAKPVHAIEKSVLDEENENENKKTNVSFIDNKYVISEDKFNNTNLSESTTLLGAITLSSPTSLDNMFTNSLQEQIFKSITKFSNDMNRKIAIINTELNNKILKELTEKYQKLFSDLRLSFQSDTEEMFSFIGEIKHMLNLPEDQLTQAIRSRKFSK